MSNTNTGGPAFPNAAFGSSRNEQQGMTLRDYFAAKAMQGLMGRAWADPKTGKQPDNIQEIWATGAYQVADAMLKAREA